jgi:hypothetical protein
MQLKEPLFRFSGVFIEKTENGSFKWVRRLKSLKMMRAPRSANGYVAAIPF